MGFFSNIFKRGRAYSDRNPKLACELIIEGQHYLLEEFDVDFSNDDGQRYVPMYAVFADKLSPELEAWITRSSHRRDGVVKFHKNNDIMEEGAVFTLVFYDAACVRYRKTTRGEKPLTTLVLTTKHIKLQEDEFEMK